MIPFSGKKIEWSCGVTSTKERQNTLLPRTMESLANAGFEDLLVNVDGVHYQPKIKPLGNWLLLAWELYIRRPYAHRYAIFQDDLVAYRNLKIYLDRCEMPVDGYWNLFTWPINHRLSLKERELQGVPNKSKGIWYLSNQLGRGATALVFSNQGMQDLLNSRHVLLKPQWRDELGNRTIRDDPKNNSWRNIDGMVITAMREAGYMEYVHDPSLVQHTGMKSTLGTTIEILAPNFVGEDFDALDLIQ